MKPHKSKVTFAPAELGLQAWEGYRITVGTWYDPDETGAEEQVQMGYVAPVFHGRTRKWHISKQMPVRDANGVVDMKQFAGGPDGYRTLSTAIVILCARNGVEV